MNIVNWNSGGLGKKRREIELLAAKFDIICVSETKLNQHSYPIFLKNFHQIRKDSGNPGFSGGLITFIQRKIMYNRVLFDGINICMVSIKQ